MLCTSGVNMRLPPWSLAAALLCLIASVARAADCDCTAVRLLPTDVPVCDAEGVTYANACLAQCQGVSASPCASQQQQRTPRAGMAALHPEVAAQGEQLMAPLLFHPDTLDSQVPITLADIEAFKAEGFRLAARIKLIPGQVSTPGLAPAGDSQVSGPASTHHAIAASRITRTGLLYLLPRSSAAAARGALVQQQFIPAFRGSLASTGSQEAASGARIRWRSRKLLQPVGRDDRWEVTSFNGAHTYPYTAVGMLTSGCSGGLIGPSTVLSAGHCVYNTSLRSFNEEFDFVPNRHDGGAHCDRSDLSGRCTFSTADRVVRALWADTWFNNAKPPVVCKDGKRTCQSKQDFAFDISLIRLEEPVGSTYGWLGLEYSCRSLALQVDSAGYPADRDDTMSHMFGTRGTLEPFSGCLDKDDKRGVVSSNLDTAGGQSGSSIWDSNNRVRAIHVSGGPGHRTIVREYYEWILQNRA